MRADVRQTSDTSGLGTFPRLLRNIKGEGEQSEMGVACMCEIPPRPLCQILTQTLAGVLC